MTSLRVKRIALDGMLLGVAMMLSYLEAVLPLSFVLPLPGAKVGLANVAVTLCFYMISPIDAFIINIARISLTALLFGNLTSFIFALVGGMLAYGGMWLTLAFYRRVSMWGISVMCAALHNLGQCLAGAVIMHSIGIFSYLPWLLVFAVVFGLINGYIIIQLTKLKVFKNV